MNKKLNPKFCNTISVIVAMFFMNINIALAEVFEVDQRDKQFSLSTLSIKEGDTIKFKNSDPMMHNIYSFSDIDSFDLGSYPKGNARSHTFKKKGLIKVECVVHPRMSMIIEVK